MPPLGPFAAISAAALAAACSLSNPNFNYSESDSGASATGATISTSTSTSGASETLTTTESTGENTESGPSMAELKHYEEDDCQHNYPCMGSPSTITLNVECFESEIAAPFILDHVGFNVRQLRSSPPAELQIYEYDEDKAMPKEQPFATRPLEDIQQTGPIDAPIMPVEITNSHFCVGIAAGDESSIFGLGHTGTVPQSGISFLTRTTDVCPVGQHTDVKDLDDVGNWCISAFIHN